MIDIEPPALGPKTWSLMRTLALVLVADRPLPHFTLARAYTLLGYPDTMVAHAPACLQDRARSWAASARTIPSLERMLLPSLKWLCARGVLRHSEDGIEATEHAPSPDRVDAWFRHEASLALEVSAALEAS